jgi:phage-related protein
MKFDLIILEQALKELNSLEALHRNAVIEDYKLVKSKGLEYVLFEPLKDGIFEIKSGRIRSLYGFKEDQKIIVAVVFLKKTQKTPDNIKRLAKRRLDNYDRE